MNISNKMQGKSNIHTESGKPTILITAGPTYEKIDPVRFIGNYSSGKMGFALTEECLKRGFQVELILGPVELSESLKSAGPELHVTHVESALQMYNACMEIYPGVETAILCAAVADFTPVEVADKKIKREGDDLIIRLKPTHDIAASLGKIKTKHQTLAGFALETNDEQANAKSKLQRKNFDFIVLNSLQDEGAGFRHDTNKITIITRADEKTFPLESKKECAKHIIDHLISILPQ